MHYMIANSRVAEVDDPNAWALLLDPDGFGAEGTGANFFIVNGGNIATPEGRNIRRGTRRAYVMQMAQRLGVPCEEIGYEPGGVTTYRYGAEDK